MTKCTDLILLTVGNIFCAVAVGMVALPLSISLGGTSGLGRILNALIPIRLSVWVMILNVVLFSFAYFMVGKKLLPKHCFLHWFFRFFWKSFPVLRSCRS